MSQSDYVTACCLGKRIVILEGLREVLRQQKAIGNNLNQLAVLANMGKVQFANLDSAVQEFAKINIALRELQEGGVARNRNRPFRELQKGHADARLHEKRHALRLPTQQDALGRSAARQRHRLPAGNGVRRVSQYKLLHHKDGGVMFYHMVQSFPKGANVDPRTAHEAARRLAGYFNGCEVLVCTHVDREHIHSHCIINSVNFETGRKVHMADEQIQELRIRNDQICEELGLPKFQKDGQRQSGGMSNAEYYTAVKGESWKLELMRVIDECMRCAGSPRGISDLAPL